MLTRRRFSILFSAGVTLGGRPAGAAAPGFWPGEAKAAVSLTYDDGLPSQLDYASPQLRARGMRATFFLTEQNMRARLDDWRRAAAAGNEIGDHTVTHPCVLRRYSAESFSRLELEPMERFLDDNFGASRFKSYAYPCDNTSLGGGPQLIREARYRDVVGPMFQAARTTEGPPNAPGEVLANRLFLNGFEPTYDRDAVEPAFRYLRRAMTEGGWAILVFHEVLPRRMGVGDTCLRNHGRILDWIGGQPIWCAPMGEVFTHIRRTLGDKPGERIAAAG